MLYVVIHYHNVFGNRVTDVIVMGSNGTIVYFVPVAHLFRRDPQGSAESAQVDEVSLLVVAVASRLG